MSAPRVYGWCPGALKPMMSGDGLVVRIRAPMGRLTSQQAAGIADLSRRFGNGRLDLSSRANLQMRGISEDGHEALIEGLRRLDLIDQTEAHETRRNVVVEPFWTKGDATHVIATRLNAALAEDTAPDLPGKFGFSVDCATRPVLTNTSADIRIERGQGGLICRPDGALAGIPVTPDTAVETALAMARWFIASGGAPGGRGRMAAHIARVGRPEGCNAAIQAADKRPAPGPTPTGLLVALEFGQMSAETFATLATEGALRLTPWRMLLMEDTAQIEATPDLITDPADPRLSVTACTGAPACPQALSRTRDIARRLAKHSHGNLHVSGCAKGCAHPLPAARTLVATAPDRFDLILDGRTTDRPVKTGLTPTDLLRGEL